jgi:hypothetical protein
MSLPALTPRRRPVCATGTVIRCSGRAWATIIPAVTVPLSLVGTFALRRAVRAWLQSGQAVAHGAVDRGWLRVDDLYQPAIRSGVIWVNPCARGQGHPRAHPAPSHCYGTG